MVLTKWQSQERLDIWLKDPDYLELVAELDKYTIGPATYKVMSPPKDHLFLL